MNAVTTSTPKTPKVHTLTRQGLATLGKLTIAGLLGGFLSYIILLIRIGDLVVPILIVLGCLLLAAVVIASGWRWAPALGALLGIGTSIAAVAQPDSLSSDSSWRVCRLYRRSVYSGVRVTDDRGWDWRNSTELPHC